MKHILMAGIVAATAALLPPGAAAQVSDCIPIETVPATISSSGQYCLVADATVNLTTGPAIRINANNVTIDCRNNTLQNLAESNAGGSMGILAISRANITIRNCRIVGGFTDAIHVTQPMGEFNSSFYNRIVDNYIAGPWRYGIVAYGSAVEVKRNTIWDVGGQSTGVVAGIRIGGAAQSANKFQIVDGNEVIGTNSQVSHAYAIVSDGSIGSLFRGNTISGTAGFAPTYRGYGIFVGNGSALTVRDNHILGRGQSNETGIQLPANGGKCYRNDIGVNNVPYVGCNTANGNY